MENLREERGVQEHVRGGPAFARVRGRHTKRAGVDASGVHPRPSGGARTYSRVKPYVFSASVTFSKNDRKEELEQPMVVPPDTMPTAWFPLA